MEADLKTALGQVGQIIAQIAELSNSIDKHMDGIDKRIGELATGQAVMTARLDEQSATINALIAARLAAVPPAAT